MATPSFHERYDSIVSSMLELGAELKQADSSGEVLRLRSQLSEMQAKGVELQSALEKSQEELRQAAESLGVDGVLRDPVIP